MSDPKQPKLPEGITPLYLRHAVLRVQRWARRAKANPAANRSVPRHIHEKSAIVRDFLKGQQA